MNLKEELKAKDSPGGGVESIEMGTTVCPKYTDGMTLQELVARAIERQEVKTNWFQTLLRIYGKEKIRKLWQEYQTEKKRKCEESKKNE